MVHQGNFTLTRLEKVLLINTGATINFLFYFRVN